MALVQVAKAYMAAARPCPRGFVLDHQWAPREVAKVVVASMASEAVVAARHRVHHVSPLNESCLRIAGRCHQP